MSRVFKFNEDTRVKLPATLHFLRLGYNYQSLKGANIDFDTKIFIDRFKNSLQILNKRAFSDDEIKAVLDEIHDIIRNNDMGKAFYEWLINPLDKVKLIDLEDWSKNDFAVVDELPFTVVEGSEQGSFRPDINILVNGIPLAFLEVKKPNNEGGIQKEFDRMVRERLRNHDYVKFFNLIQIVSFSNNMEYEEEDDAEDVSAGSFYSTPNGQHTSFSFFREDNPMYHTDYKYQKLEDNYCKNIIEDLGYASSHFDTPEFQENMNLFSPCHLFITSFYDRERFIYFLRYGITYIEEQIRQKHIMRYPQFFASRKILERLETGGRSGIIWHTQGSGKTALSAFAISVLTDYYASKNINARFFFVVDRLELLNQASVEFTHRGLDVVNCNNRAEFTNELKKVLPTNSTAGCKAEVCVVNIQKFESNIPKARNPYNTKVQRIFFIDEAHRSYAMKGEFFKNLMCCDTDAVYIALTGTPLLTKQERSNLKFGDYIHKYFYDKSIADGYTLRIKKENIDTVARKQIKANLQLENRSVDEKEVFESDAYISCLGRFIEKDFKYFRLENQDDSIGGMVVCRTNLQAKKMSEWFKNNSNLSVGLVISDDGDPVQKAKNKTYQHDFRNTLAPDMLIVNYMLTTGYDVKRLKKMYLLRGPHAQSLLQTISRVNRPYKAPSGKVYKFGYIVDFVDIEKEYDSTVNAYLKELNEDDDKDIDYTGLVVDKEDIKKKYDRYISELEDMGLDLDNLERFSKTLNNFSKEALYKVRRILNGIKSCRTEFILSQADEYLNLADSDKVKKQSTITQNRIDFLNLSTKTIDSMSLLSDKRIVEIIYEFIKTRIDILDLSKFAPDSESAETFKRRVADLHDEINKNRNKQDTKMIELDKLLQEIFNKLSIGDLDDLDSLNEELKNAYMKAKAINDENDRLASIYGNHFGFVRTYKDSYMNYEGLDKSEIEHILILVYNVLKDELNTESIVIQGRSNFISSVKARVTTNLFKEGLFVKICPYYDDFLGSLYTNIQLYR